jgi:singapore isolate B (sub-type 7) whole genome shotgun sequence assembly, scaffold_4
MEGAKFYDDSFFNNEVYAKIGGVPVEELNHLELEFVFLIGFSLVIAPEEYQRIHNDLFRHCRMICHSCRRFVWRGLICGFSLYPLSAMFRTFPYPLLFDSLSLQQPRAND